MPPRTLEIEPNCLAAPAITEAAAALRRGAVVALPTETVYGLFVVDEPGPREALQKLKGRPEKQPFTYHIASREELDRRLPALPERARRLADRLWPGPLTLVVPDAAGPDGWSGFRQPALGVCRAVLARVGKPVVGTSANLSGEPDALDAKRVADTFADLELILDAGPAQLGRPSTVVRVAADGEWSVLREGFIPTATVRRVCARVIVFVCTGNTCRSPMAEALLRRRLAERLGIEPDPDELAERGFVIVSAGTSAYADGPASPGSLVAMNARKIDISGHRSRPVTADLMEDASLVFVMGHGHAHMLTEWWPEHADKVFLLDPAGVSDPVGASDAMYERCAEQIDAALAELIDVIADPTRQADSKALAARAIDAASGGRRQ